MSQLFPSNSKCLLLSLSLSPSSMIWISFMMAHWMYLVMQVLVDSILATLRERLNIPPVPAPEHPSSSVFNDSFVVCIDGKAVMH